jgi:SAM-dependent methyltransferase
VSFYSDFAEHYEAVFPYREPVYNFLMSQLTSHSTSSGRRVLDLGCGTGHYAGHLAAAGHTVVGIDLDPAMISVAQQNYPAVDFHVMNLDEVGSLSPGFDLVFCIGNVLSHLPADRLHVFLQHLNDLMSPGACWLFQVVNWDAILSSPTHRFPDRTLPETGVVFQREYLDITTDSLRFVTRLIRKDHEIFTGEVMLYPVTAQEYRSQHEAAGFRLTGHHSDYLGALFDPTNGAANIMIFRKYMR